MLKYVDTKEVFAEVPDEITLAISISGCPIHCEGCHSKYLWNNVGTELTVEALDKLIEEHRGITCVLFSGGDNDVKAINALAKHIKEEYCGSIKTAWYSGEVVINQDMFLKNLDYIKVGPYDAKCGPLTSKTTNQRMYEVINTSIDTIGVISSLNDITYKFQKKDETDN